MGSRVGEVTDTTAIVWTRITKDAERNTTGEVHDGRIRKNTKYEKPEDPNVLRGACPGAPGRVKVVYGVGEKLDDRRETEWAEVNKDGDYSHRFKLTGLEPATDYYYVVQTTDPQNSPHAPSQMGHFQTAPKPSTPADVTFCVTTCLMVADLDHADGFNIFTHMKEMDPQFVAFTGDNVYYDSDLPRAVSPELARFHWQRMYSLPRHVDLLRSVATYWEKDDHDVHSNDSWPGIKPAGKLTFAEGQKIFRQQVPMGESIYRTYRWGKHLQVWLTDGRDFRSPNNMQDGPDKTIWGAEQKAWLKKTLAASDATWKVLISPTPIVGPDRKNKNDNHANEGFKHEGDEFRAWVKKNVADNFFVICGDRHWQYHSQHPDTGLNEFACGPGSDEHASGTPGENKQWHRFHRVKGGFLSVNVRDGGIVFRHHDVKGDIVYEWNREK